MRAFRIAYDGRPFYGFQRQPDVPTVEDALLDGLEALDVLDPDADSGVGVRPTPPGYAAAGRTDAGVAALAQTIAFEAPAWLTPRALNGALPDSVHAWAHADVPSDDPDAPADFHATHDATRRQYTYHLHAPAADPDLAADALDRIVGEHDFAALTTDDTGTVRTLETGATWAEPYLVIQVAAGGFPRHLVRRLASLVDLVATGERAPSFVDRVLDGSSVPESDGVPTAPAEPLVLADVAYPGLSFSVDETAATSARDALERRRREARTRSRTMAELADGLGAE
ncbi:tRNA pseudouridine synthase A [Salinarchaeum sp. Harcht-Bsk1]|uniref:tRNA pseudouridine(38-40) synthase TruA n=1 Tax=Salinarchaeum sp. Harcht-Bsk1 TaxID=1333523 RepID=UPI00034238C2|nr:tRNA pseudouridine(38-40) synthase TruA [Salinarchaeum sp. Harcht-Bsk1]AGN01953.1 tRNA pseudouridine synthase A [Salinarchaeum sp. Harcht-Bsk1]